MAREEHGIEASPAASVSQVTDQAIADEIRVIQSIQVQRSMPVILYGNASVVVVTAYFYWQAVIASHAYWAMLVVLLLLAPMARSYLRLRKRPRPKIVSRRRIRIITTHSLLMGLAWSVFATMLFPHIGSVYEIISVVVALFLSFGAVVLMPSIPWAAVAFFLPILLASFITGITNGIVAADILSVIYLLCSLAILKTAAQNWQNVTASVRVSLERLQEEAEHKKVLETVLSQVGKYMSPQLYQAIFSGEQKVEIASKRKKLTLFFSDIANFTEITDQLESEELTALLNQYLTEMSKIALEYGATIDKFIGDAMVLYFGDPETKGVKKDAAACVQMAIAMQRRLKNLQVEWREQGLIDRPFETRIGINTGYCTVGNFGSEDRMDYTIIGSEVNLAARLEANADAGGILLTYGTYSLVNDWLLAEEQEAIAMKGFAKPIGTYRVTGIYDELAAEGRVIHRDQTGLSLTIERDKLSREDKAKAIQTLKEVQARLEE